MVSVMSLQVLRCLPVKGALFSAAIFLPLACADWGPAHALRHHLRHKNRVKAENAVADALHGGAGAERELANAEKHLRSAVVAIRGSDYQSRVRMYQDANALQAIQSYQDVTQRLLRLRYARYLSPGGPLHARGTVLRVRLEVFFPAHMPDESARGRRGTIVVETAPIEIVPHSVFTFMELIRGWRRAAVANAPPPRWAEGGGEFHRNAGHVLQVQTYSGGKGLAFQEYDERFPHRIGTLGFAGRPGGPAFYISTMDNVENHGPGSQGSTMGEADACFGRVVQGQDVVQRLLKVWGRQEHGFKVDEMGFLSDDGDHAIISPFIELPHAFSGAVV